MAAAMSMPRPRNAGIDLLRGIAIALVLLLHFHLAYHLRQSPGFDAMPRAVQSALLINGNYGVTMFFAISGFLIARNSMQRWGRLAAIDARAFYANRFARILPPLLLALAVIVALGCAGRPSFENTAHGAALAPGFFLIAAGSVLTFWHNVLMQHAGWFNYAMNIYWSLSVEEMFYLGFPLLCLGVRRDRWIVVACVACIIVGPLYRGMHSDDELFFECGYWACFDAIAMGVTAALLVTRLHIGIRLATVIRLAACGLLVGAFLFGIDGHERFGFSAVAFATAVLLVLLGDDDVRERDASMAERAEWTMRLSPLAGLRWMGLHSYELYLFHIIALGSMRDLVPAERLGPAAKLGWFGLFVLGSLLLAALVARFVSEPLNAYLRRWFATRSRTAPVAPDARIAVASVVAQHRD